MTEITYIVNETLLTHHMYPVRPLGLLIVSSGMQELIDDVSYYFDKSLELPSGINSPSEFCEKPNFVFLSDLQLSKPEQDELKKRQVSKIFYEDLNDEELHQFVEML